MRLFKETHKFSFSQARSNSSDPSLGTAVGAIDTIITNAINKVNELDTDHLTSKILIVTDDIWKANDLLELMVHKFLTMKDCYVDSSKTNFDHEVREVLKLSLSSDKTVTYVIETKIGENVSVEAMKRYDFFINVESTISNGYLKSNTTGLMYKNIHSVKNQADFINEIKNATHESDVFTITYVGDDSDKAWELFADTCNDLSYGDVFNDINRPPVAAMSSPFEKEMKSSVIPGVPISFVWHKTWNNNKLYSILDMNSSLYLVLMDEQIEAKEKPDDNKTLSTSEEQIISNVYDINLILPKRIEKDTLKRLIKRIDEDTDLPGKFSEISILSKEWGNNVKFTWEAFTTWLISIKQDITITNDGDMDGDNVDITDIRFALIKYLTEEADKFYPEETTEEPAVEEPITGDVVEPTDDFDTSSMNGLGDMMGGLGGMLGGMLKNGIPGMDPEQTAKIAETVEEMENHYWDNHIHYNILDEAVKDFDTSVIKRIGLLTKVNSTTEFNMEVRNIVAVLSGYFTLNDRTDWLSVREFIADIRRSIKNELQQFCGFKVVDKEHPEKSRDVAPHMKLVQEQMYKKLEYILDKIELEVNLTNGVLPMNTKYEEEDKNETV